MPNTYGFNPGWTNGLGGLPQEEQATSPSGLVGLPILQNYLAYGQILDAQKQRQQALADQTAFREARGALGPNAQPQDYARTAMNYAGPADLLKYADDYQKLIDARKKQESIDQMGAALKKRMESEGGNLSPETYRGMGFMNLLNGNHAAAAPLFQESDRTQKLIDEQRALKGMTSSPEMQAVGEQGPNIPTAARSGAVPNYLMRSQYVGPGAKALQERIDAGVITSSVAEKNLENLTSEHNRMAQQEAILQQRGEQKLNVTGGRESVYIQRMMMGANQASKDLANVVQLPLTASTGVLGGRKQGTGLFDAGKEVLANKATSQESQAYNAMATGFQRSLAQIESAGLMPSGSLTHQMDAVLFKEGDTNLTKLHKLAQTRQIVEAGMEVIDANPRVSAEEKAKVKGVLDSIRKSVPFTHSDLIQMQVLQDADPRITLGDVIKNKAGSWSIRPK